MSTVPISSAELAARRAARLDQTRRNEETRAARRASVERQQAAADETYAQIVAGAVSGTWANTPPAAAVKIGRAAIRALHEAGIILAAGEAPGMED